MQGTHRRECRSCPANGSNKNFGVAVCHIKADDAHGRNLAENLLQHLEILIRGTGRGGDERQYFRAGGGEFLPLLDGVVLVHAGDHFVREEGPGHFEGAYAVHVCCHDRAAPELLPRVLESEGPYHINLAAADEGAALGADENILKYYY